MNIEKPTLKPYTLPSRSKSQPHEPKLVNKYDFSNAIKDIGKRKHIPPTMYIKNCRNSSEIKHCSPIENWCKLENQYSEIGNFSYTER